MITTTDHSTLKGFFVRVPERFPNKTRGIFEKNFQEILKNYNRISGRIQWINCNFLNIMVSEGFPGSLRGISRRVPMILTEVLQNDFYNNIKMIDIIIQMNFWKKSPRIIWKNPLKITDFFKISRRIPKKISERIFETFTAENKNQKDFWKISKGKLKQFQKNFRSNVSGISVTIPDIFPENSRCFF